LVYHEQKTAPTVKILPVKNTVRRIIVNVIAAVIAIIGGAIKEVQAE
jgi:hypothetical protein